MNFIYIISPNPKYNEQGDFNGDCGYRMMGNVELENFISKQLFPIGVVPTEVINYLKQKHLREIKYIRDYVLSHVSCSKENPIQLSQIKDSIKMALIEANIDIKELRTFNEEEFMIGKLLKLMAN